MLEGEDGPVEDPKENMETGGYGASSMGGSVLKRCKNPGLCCGEKPREACQRSSYADVARPPVDPFKLHVGAKLKKED